MAPLSGTSAMDAMAPFDLSRVDHAQGQTLYGLVERVARRNPEKVCLRLSGGASFTYKQIQDAMVNCAASVVLFESSTVLLVADRSCGMMVCMLGVMCAGKAYCPVEPDYPGSRVRSMVETANISEALVPWSQVPQEVLDHFLEKPLVIDKHEIEHPPSKFLKAFAVADDGHVTLYHDTAVSAPRSSERVPEVVADSTPAYVLFTSGSTGRPKGCCVPHRGSAIYGQAVAEVCNTDSSMVFLLKTPYVFDVHLQDIYSAFAAGATLVVAPPGAHKDASAIADIIIEEKINVSCFVPTLLVEFVNHLKNEPSKVAQVKSSLRRVLCIGEALMTATCQELVDLVPDVQIHNLYGPTEASVGVSHFQVDAKILPSLSASPVVPIGKPFPYVSFRIFDHSKYDGKTIEQGLLADKADGEVGELFIGGDCLAHGYINDEEKTAAAFFNFPQVQARPTHSASAFSLYKTGDLVKKRPDGVFEYLGRSDFQVKIGGVRIECEEVSSVLKTHPAVQDALVCAFEGPFGKALAAYIVADPNTDWQQHHVTEDSPDKIPEGDDEDGDKDLVSKWGAVYDEMYQDSGEGVSEGDPTLNWSGYVDTYSRRTHIEPVIKEWVEWSCDLVLRHQKTSFPSAEEGGTPAPGGRARKVVELGCGNGMLLFRIAPIVAKTPGGCYVGTDISNSGLNYVKGIMARGPPYGGLPIETHKCAAHETLDVAAERSVDVVLCNGVTMYFPSTAYLLECMQNAAKATIDGGFTIFGDFQSKRHLMAFHADVQTFQALRRPNATPPAVLRAARKQAATEQLSYFDDTLIYRLEQAGHELFDGRLVRIEMGIKRGWWHSEFNRFRYDVELVVGSPATVASAQKIPTVQRRRHQEVCGFLGQPCVDELVLEGEQIQRWACAEIEKAGATTDGFAVTLPNARMLRPVRLLQWLQSAEHSSQTLDDLPNWLRPVDMELGGSKEPGLAKFGVEPEALFEMKLPAGWTQRIIWAEDPAMLELVVLREEAAERRWLSALRAAPAVSGIPSEEELAGYKNRQADYAETSTNDSRKTCHDALRSWAMNSPLLPAMRPQVYVALEEFPKNQAGKTDRGQLPDARAVLDKVSDAAALAFEAPSNEEETKMAKIWEEVLKVSVSVATPLLAYGVNSLVALTLASKIMAAFGIRPDLAFLMSEDCTVAALVRQLKAQKSGDDGSSDQKGRKIIRISPENRRGISLLILGAAGTSSATYKDITDHFDTMQVYVAELPGRGTRTSEPLEHDIEELLNGLQSEVDEWAQGRSFVVWGDSLGAVIAYELLVRMSEKGLRGVLGLCISGNAGPSVAAKERGMGESVEEYLGKSVASVSDMTDADWDKFFLAASAEDGAETEQIKELLANPDLRQQAMGPLVADCAAYESYKNCDGRHVRCPILTIRGSKDRITAPDAMASWADVANGRHTHKEFQGVGHMVAKEAPRKMAKVMENHFLPDFTALLGEYRGFRAGYERLRRGGHHAHKFNPASRTHFTPTLGLMGVPKDLHMQIDLEPLKLSETLAPLTQQVKEMRSGNARWRLGGAKGNPGRNPL